MENRRLQVEISPQSSLEALSDVGSPCLPPSRPTLPAPWWATLPLPHGSASLARTPARGTVGVLGRGCSICTAPLPPPPPHHHPAALHPLYFQAGLSIPHTPQSFLPTSTAQSNPYRLLCRSIAWVISMTKVSGGPIYYTRISTPLWFISLTNLSCASWRKRPRDNNSRYALTYGIPGVIKLSDNGINLSRGLGIKSETVSCCGFLFISVLLNCISLPPTKSACCLQL